MNTSPFLVEKIQDGAAGLAIENLVSAITAGYHTQHNADDTHGTITASGSISERARTTPMGVWITLPYSGITFGSDTATATWTVTSANVQDLRYMLMGQTMTVRWSIFASAVGTAAARNVYFTLPLGTVIPTAQYTAFPFSSNGVAGTGFASAVQRPNGGPGSINLNPSVDGTVNWAISGALYVFGQIAFEVTGI